MLVRDTVLNNRAYKIYARDFNFNRIIQSGYRHKGIKLRQILL